jgi:PPOX class probable F420-dependent enzyme
MTKLSDPDVQELLTAPYYAVLSTRNRDGSIHSTVVWQDVEDGHLTVNSALGRKWPTNLEHNPQVNVVVMDPANPYHFVEIRGTADGTIEGADAHIDALSRKYIGTDYPYRRPDEQRIKFTIAPERVRVVKMSRRS